MLSYLMILCPSKFVFWSHARIYFQLCKLLQHAIPPVRSQFILLLYLNRDIAIAHYSLCCSSRFEKTDMKNVCKVVRVPSYTILITLF